MKYFISSGIRVALPLAFADAIARARHQSAYGLADEIIEIADAATIEDNPQLVRNRCDQRRWIAGKFNDAFSDRIAVSTTDRGDSAEQLARMTDEQRLQWAMGIAARARKVLQAPEVEHEEKGE